MVTGPLTEELLMLVRGKRSCREELMTDGHVSSAEILVCTIFWRSALASNTASALETTEAKRKERRNGFRWEVRGVDVGAFKNKTGPRSLLHRRRGRSGRRLTCFRKPAAVPSTSSAAFDTNPRQSPTCPPACLAQTAGPQLEAQEVRTLSAAEEKT